MQTLAFCGAGAALQGEKSAKRLLSKGTHRSYIKAKTCGLYCWRRSSKLLGGDRFLRPRLVRLHSPQSSAAVDRWGAGFQAFRVHFIFDGQQQEVQVLTG